jgi:hypothetical protein
MNLKYPVLAASLSLLAACETTPYYDGETKSVTSPVGADVATCRDADGMSYAVGQSNGRQICTVDLSMQGAYCIHPENDLPFSVTAKNVKFSNKMATCVRSKASATGAVWIEPGKARTLVIDSLKNAEKVNCDYLQHEPFYKYEIDLKHSVLDLHGGFTHEYELPIKWNISDDGELAVKVLSEKSNLTMKIQYNEGDGNKGYEFFGNKHDRQGDWKVVCTIVQ